MEKNITPDTVISALASQTSSTASDFPIDVFPAKLQRIVQELHTSCGFPTDYTASAMLAAISVAIGNTHRVEVKRNWRESAIIYIAIVGRPGANKSHPLKVWKHSNGHNNLPDKIIIPSDLVTGSGHAQDKSEFHALCHFIFERGSRHGFKHFAVEPPIVTFTKEVTVPDTLIPCMKFA